eukprot:11460796-Alexandrium_andersonii.AAC.1
MSPPRSTHVTSLILLAGRMPQFVAAGCAVPYLSPWWWWWWLRCRVLLAVVVVAFGGGGGGGGVFGV